MGRLGVEHVQSDARQPARLQGGQGGVRVEQATPAAVDQDRSRLDTGQQPLVHEVPGALGERRVQGEHIARRGQFTEAGAGELGRRRAERVVRERPHPEGDGEFAHPAADTAVADDPEGGAVQVADRYGGSLGPAAVPYQVGQRSQPLGQMQGHGEDMTHRAMTLTFVDAARGVADVLADRQPAAVANPDWNHRKATA